MILIQLLGLASFLCFIPCTAQAYIDPGSGSFMLQMFIASLIGAGLTIKMYFKAFKENFKKFFCCKAKNSQENKDSSDNDS